MYRVGLPRYANVAPLARYLGGEGLSLVRAVPTELNRALLAGELELSLVSSVFFLQHQEELDLLPDFSVAVLGRVYSVNLFSRVPLAELERVALTTESATSVALLRLLLEERGVRPEYRRESGGLELLERYQGVLLIGDRAVQAYASLLSGLPEGVHRLPQSFRGIHVHDLAELWYRRTRLPFVFAVWAHRRGEPPPREVVRSLRAARYQGLGRLAEVAGEEARRLGVHPVLMQHYLWNFRYHLEEPDRDGLNEFARSLGLDRVSFSDSR